MAAILIACPLSVSAQRFIRGAVHNFYAATTGRAGGTGSLGDPWDLATALSHPPTVRPGDQIWIRGGTYLGNFLSKLTGTASAPIRVRPYIGEHVTIDANNSVPTAVISVQGGYTWFEGLEVTNTNTDRHLLTSGSNPATGRGDGFDIYAPHIKVINCVVHDTANGFGLWTPGTNSEVYGNIVFNTGWDAPDRDHGHGIYAQNDTGLKMIRENIVFDPFSNVIQIYGSSAAFLNNFLIEGNIFFNGRILIGGSAPARNINFAGNYLYNRTVEFGYSNQQNSDLSVTGNYLPSGMIVKWWNGANIGGNTLSAVAPNSVSLSITPLDGTGLLGYVCDRNTYVEGINGDAHVYIPGLGYPFTFAKWQSMGFEAAGTTVATGKKRPVGVQVFVRPNEYDPDRAHIIVYNWDHKDTVSVDISSLGFGLGDEFEVHNVQDYFGPSLTGIYDRNPIVISTKDDAVTLPYGFDAPRAPSTLPEFGVFLIRKVSERERRVVGRRDVRELLP